MLESILHMIADVTAQVYHLRLRVDELFRRSRATAPPGASTATSVPLQLFAVKLTTDGGSSGSSTVETSYTYTVKDYDSLVTIGTAKPVLFRRLAAFEMSPATKGMAFYDTGNTLRLLCADERSVQINCS